MRWHVTTLLFVILEQINKIFTQTMPISPCPKLFQYRFDGTEWFGVLSVRNPDYVQALHLKVTLSMRGKPTTSYLGEIELLTRGQFRREMPVVYKVKFPKTHFPPRLLQIMANNQVICLGVADQSIFLTQIILEHTRKFTFIPNADGQNDDSVPFTPDFLNPPTSSVSSPTDDDSGIGDNTGLNAKHIESAFEKKPLHGLQENCGRIDERIRFQIAHAMPSRRRVAKKNVPPVAEELLRLSVSTGGANVDGPLVTADEDDDDGGQATPIEFNSSGGTSTDAADLELPSVTRGAWPWLAAIYVNNLTSLAYQCGGTLVSPRIVISSAHCFHMYQKRYTANEVLVFLGRHNLRNWNEEGSLAAPVDDIFIHPDYDSHLNTYDADIAVVLLKHVTHFNTFIRPACMWSGSSKMQYLEGELGIVVGWGLASYNANNASAVPNTSAVPRVVTAPIVANEVCYRANLQYHSLSSNRTFCAGIVTTTRTATDTAEVIKGARRQRQRTQKSNELCTGDSGAGLMIYKNKRWMLRGVVSASLAQTNNNDRRMSKNTSICSRNQYVIYTDVAKFLDWVFAFII